MLVIVFFFFFQAEDGIRDRNVTGVQTCALPILFCINFCVIWCDADPWFCGSVSKSGVWCIIPLHRCASVIPGMNRSEERRVGKECSSRWSADTDKKNG